MSVTRTMIEKTYAELAVGDCVWSTGALLKITRVLPSRGLIRYFETTVMRAGSGYTEGEFAVLSGLAAGAVLLEVL